MSEEKTVPGYFLDVFGSLGAAIKERLGNRYVSAYLISFVLWNWYFLLRLIFGSEPPEVRIHDFHDAVMLQWHYGSSSCHFPLEWCATGFVFFPNIMFPLFGSLLWLFGLSWLFLGLDRFYTKTVEQSSALWDSNKRWMREGWSKEEKEKAYRHRLRMNEIDRIIRDAEVRCSGLVKDFEFKFRRISEDVLVMDDASFLIHQLASFGHSMESRYRAGLRACENARRQIESRPTLFVNVPRVDPDYAWVIGEDVTVLKNFVDSLAPVLRIIEKNPESDKFSSFVYEMESMLVALPQSDNRGWMKVMLSWHAQLSALIKGYGENRDNFLGWLNSAYRLDEDPIREREIIPPEGASEG